MNKLIKLSDTHYIVVDDSEIKEDDWYWTPIKRSIEQCVKKLLVIKDGDNDLKQFKITHSTQPLSDVKFTNFFDKIKPLSLSEVEEAINGHSIEKMAENFADYAMEEMQWASRMKRCIISSYIQGFKAHQELVKDKLFTVEDMEDAITMARQRTQTSKSIIQSLLPPTEWDVEFVDGKLKIL